MSKYCKWCTRNQNNKCEIAFWRNIDELNINGKCGFLKLYERKPNLLKRIVLKFKKLLQQIKWLKENKYM